MQTSDAFDEIGEHVANWLQYYWDGFRKYWEWQESQPKVVPTPGAERTPAQAPDIDWEAVYEHNHANTQAAAEGEELRYQQAGYAVLIGEGHSREVQYYLSVQPEANLNGTLTVEHAGLRYPHAGCGSSAAPSRRNSSGRWRRRRRSTSPSGTPEVGHRRNRISLERRD